MRTRLKHRSFAVLTAAAVLLLAKTDAIDPEEACLTSSTCWLQYNFNYDDSYSSCSGDRYVRKTGQTTGRYIGVILCSSTRYKLVMADNLTETFLNIGDGSGAGEDQCTLIGGDEKSARVASDFWNCPATQGFYRSFATEIFKRGKIGYGPKDLSQWTGKYYPTWYECGVTVPGNASVFTSTKPLLPAVTTTTSPPTPATWDDVTFGQAKFTVDRTFVVPPGVTKVDVICIGGGGGGRDGHASGMVTGDGGNSTFGGYLSAEGGKGASGDNSGGQGGYGTVANGGQGGAGGGCSAGAGAAGQTRGGGHGGKQPGSSTYPFCGAGGSSGGSSCGSEFGPGKSGPGGVDPKGRAGGFYGGGGGSRAGGRAGGGGGYSQAVIEVTPGERIPLKVGKRGSPAYWAGQPASGVVVVAWGGPIDPTGSFVDYFSVSEPAPPTTTAPPTTPITTLPRKTCFGSYCSGGYRMRATCVNGFCECGAEGYNKYTCLPEVGSCRILANQDSALGVPSVSSGTAVHSCVGSSANSSYEVHVIGIYENTGSRSVVQSTSVNIVGRTRKPMVLVLSNYEPVRWVIQKGPSLNIEKILLYSYYLDESSVENSPVPVTKAGRDLALGDDSGGGNTAGLLTALRDTYGDVASFTGTYRTSSWTLRLPDFNTSVLTPSSTEHLPVTYRTNTSTTTTTVSALPRKACLGSYCSGGYRMKATCVNGFCECGGEGYNKYTCLPEVGSCRILANQDSALGVPSVSSGTAVHSCVGSSANSSYEVHVIGIYENTGSRSIVQSTSVNIVGRTRKPLVLVLSSYEPVRWIIQKGPSVNIAKVLLYSYHLDESSVQGSPVTVTKADRLYARGDDSGGGSTKELLTLLMDTYGNVASFTGTYRTRSWTLTLPDVNTSATPYVPTTELLSTAETASPTTTTPTISTIALPRKKCFGSYCSGGYRLKATCVNGFCECGAEGYNKYTCLPEVGSCRILANQDSALGVPSVSSGTAVHSCVGSSANSSYEVHVIGIYENTGSRSVVQSTSVNIVGRTRKPMVLVLSSYEPVRWIIQKGPSVNIEKVLLYSYHLDESSVQGSPATVTKADRLSARGDDSGGGSTKELLTLLMDTYGDVASFTGTYRTSSWTLTLPDVNTSATPDVSTTQLLSTAETAPPTTTTATITTIDTVASCLSSSTCWLRYNFTYDDSYSACSGDRYVRKTGEITGRYIGVVLCSPTRYKLLMADNLEETFLNIGDGNGAGEDLCPLIGGDEKSAKIPSDFWTSPAVTGYYRYNAGEVFRKGPIGFGPADSSQWTGKYFPTWYECGVSVPGERTVVAFQQETTAASPTSTTETSVTPTPSVTWDAVTFGQIMYREDDVFVVPDNVTKLDVICIGGGGGGRDNHVPFSRNAGYGGDGGSSRFGDLLSAEGGKGAKGDNTGGEGGRGVTANGGQGGIGGGCSAGAGAAGQTSGGGHGGLEAGSSTHPFCGAGGSSGGSTCGREFGNIAPGKSGPGGQDPVGRDGGLYGGGGGSRAGARAGGGGGYSRRVITVTPGQNITVAVGDIGTPYYTGGRPAPGVVVVSWGGPIDPNREFQELPASV